MCVRNIHVQHQDWLMQCLIVATTTICGVVVHRHLEYGSTPRVLNGDRDGVVVIGTLIDDSGVP